jgi:bifunctional UDP-N-acetylglucosamine pyrophosphorylase/glucosamine-1-phosphate N-acetyltransferase
MTASNVAAVILAAGHGTRMKTRLPKVLHPLAGRPMINHLIETVEALGPARVVVVAGTGMEDVARAVHPHAIALQDQRLGTGHAVLAARDALAGFEGDILVLYGDTPLITLDTLRRMIAQRRGHFDPAAVVLGFHPEDPSPYGRIILDREADEVVEIVEALDASPLQVSLTLCNSGVMCLDSRRAWGLLERIGNANAKKEYYLTDLIGIAHKSGQSCLLVEGSESELLGVNSRVDLAKAEAVAQTLLRTRAMEGGATLIDPASVTLNFDTRLGQDVTVGPNVVFGPEVVIEDNVEIRAFCHIEGAIVKPGAVIGPFARLRPGAVIAEEALIGNFVEIKKSSVERGAKVNHLTYIGDARVGAGANVGAGTITCNYDGFAKHRTDIGAGAFIGSNTALVAPVKIGDGAIVGAGSVVTLNVEPDALAVARERQQNYAGWAARFRAQRKK